MNNLAAEIETVWAEALQEAGSLEDAIALLIDAAAYGLNLGDYDPGMMQARLRDSFDALHIAKYAPHLGRLA